MWVNASLDADSLTIPKFPGNKLTISHVHTSEDGAVGITDVAHAPQPFAASDVFIASASVVCRLISENGKETYCLLLSAPEIEKLTYEPGDTIGILPENPEETVLELLNHTGDINYADDQIRCVANDSKKSFLPEVTTPKLLFKHYINLRCIPQKLHLRILSGYCLDEREARILQVLCSKEGTAQYRNMILEPGVNILDVITSLPSCHPDTITLAEHLPRLLPRPYSIASSPLSCRKSMKIVFSVLPGEQAGLCTGMLSRNLAETGETTVRMYLRKSHGFRLPGDPSVPLILVGPGTGIAPYLGFLEHREHSSNSSIRGKIYLFTGYRTKRDFLFKPQIDYYLQNGVLTKLFVSYSRENAEGDRYVQDSIKKHWREIGELLDEGAHIYECGDLKLMAQSVQDAFSQVFQSYYGLDAMECSAKVKSMKSSKKYLQDVWC